MTTARLFTLTGFAAMLLAAAGCRSDSRSPIATPTPEPRESPASGSASEAGTAAAGPRVVEPAPGIRVLLDVPAVEVDAVTCLDTGWLEQVGCAPGTREHESLMTIAARPSDIHAALLLAGFQSGAPGEWRYDENGYGYRPPTGEALELFVRYQRESGEVITEPVRRWIVDDHGGGPLPPRPWVFGGSELRPNPPGMGEGEHYVADYSGSIIGLVTFGDEVIGFSEVIADQAAVQEPEWVVDTDRVPPIGTEVTVVIRRFTQ